MPRFSANLSMLFTEVPLLQRFERAARAGFSTVEVQFPYEAPAEALRALLAANQLNMVLHNLPAGHWAGGERGIACLPDRVDEFRAGVAQALHYATKLQVPMLNCLAGKAPPGVPEAVLRHTLVSNLQFAAAALQEAGLKLLLEPVNQHDIPGFFINTTAKALDALDEVGADNAYLQYDVYHAQRSEGELAATMEKHLPRIAHIQVADNPGRNEPGTGEINYSFLFAHLHRLGYTGAVGCEYKPATSTEAGLGWLQQARAQLGPQGRPG